MSSIPTWLFTSLAPARRRWAAAFVLAAAVLAFGLTGCGSPNSRLSEVVSQQPAPGNRPLLVVQSPEGDSWLRLLRAGGLAAIEEPFGYLPTDSAAVVPDDLQMTVSEVAEVKAWVHAGRSPGDR